MRKDWQVGAEMLFVEREICKMFPICYLEWFCLRNTYSEELITLLFQSSNLWRLRYLTEFVAYWKFHMCQA